MPVTFPINTGPKEDHPDRLLKLIGVDTKYYYKAEELKLYESAINELYNSIATSGISPLQTQADAWLIGGMDTRAYATNYPILTNYYTAPAKTVTHSAADATYGRQDTIVANAQGIISIIQGTPGPVIIPPTIDLNLYYPIRTLLIPANATSPVDPDTGTGITDVQKLYSEVGTEVGGESDVTTSATTIVVNSPNTPLTDAVSIEASEVQQLDTIFFSYADLQSAETKTHFNFLLKLKAEVPTDKFWFIRFYNGTTIVRSYLFKHGQNGFDATNLNIQYVSIPKELIDLTVKYDKVGLFLFHNQTIPIPGYFIDDVQWVNGLTPPPTVFTIPADSIGTRELKPELKATIDLGTSNEVNWMDGVQFKKTLTATTAITHAELVENKTTFLRLTGAQAFSIQHVVEIGDIADYDGALINVIQMHCSDATPGAEKITANWFNKF